MYKSLFFILIRKKTTIRSQSYTMKFKIYFSIKVNI